MIISTKSHRSKNGLFTRLVEYVHSDKGMAIQKDAICFYHNILSSDPKEIAQEFSFNDSFRKVRRNGIALNHIVISFSPEDARHITTPKLHDIVEKFVELRGSEALYYGRLHVSEQHPHLHLVMSANALHSDKSMRISKKELRDIQMEMERFQREKMPEISNSFAYNYSHQIDFNHRDVPWNDFDIDR